MASIGKLFAGLKRQIAELQRRQSNILRSGTVVEVDAAKGRVKVDVGNEGNPLITPWIRWSERAGARKTWSPPSVGEAMTILSGSGEVDGRALAIHGGFTDQNPAPSADGDAAVFSLGNVTATIIDGGLKLEIGGVTVEITGAGFAITGGTVTHNGANIGDTHKHGGIKPGSSQTSNPS